MNRGWNIKLSLSKQYNIIFGLFHTVWYFVQFFAGLYNSVCTNYTVCLPSLICAQMMSNEALLDESLISRFSANHHIRFAQKQLKISNSALIAKSKSCILIKRSSFLGNYFLPNCSLSPFAATAEAIPLMAVLNLLRERPVSSEEHHRPDIYSIVFHFSFYRWIVKSLKTLYYTERRGKIIPRLWNWLWI